MKKIDIEELTELLEMDASIAADKLNKRITSEANSMAQKQFWYELGRSESLQNALVGLVGLIIVTGIILLLALPSIRDSRIRDAQDLACESGKAAQCEAAVEDALVNEAKTRAAGYRAEYFATTGKQLPQIDDSSICKP